MPRQPPGTGNSGLTVFLFFIFYFFKKIVDHFVPSVI
ncbi:hypothetical protein I656_00917 [Geobacillus sp. WSUCF1]|nr:hypothetical protein I656_00917 [Geobacillus sp. WSUCF1]